MKKDNDYFQTKDLPLAATLSLWYPLQRIDKTNPDKAIFIFRKDENFNQLVEAYWRGELKVNPISYFAQLKFIKSRLYEE